LWRALGLPDVPANEEFFSDLDVQALRLISAQVRDEQSLASTLQEARILGASLARVAEVESEAVRRLLDTGTPADFPDVMGRASLIIDYVHRRQLQAALRRKLASADAGAPLAVGFVDMVGFTAISRRLDDNDLSVLLSRFEAVVYDVVVEHGCRVVKTIGDEAMFVADDPAAALRAGLRLAEEHAEDEHLPDVHVGISFGSVIARDGDYFGLVVNLGRRIADVSPPGAVVTSAELQHALAADPGFEWKPLGPRQLKDFGPVPLWVARPAESLSALGVLESLARGDIDVDEALKLIA
jgi:adenylate cyclase